MSSEQDAENFDDFQELPILQNTPPASPVRDFHDHDMDPASELTTLDSSPIPKSGRKEKRMPSITPRKFTRFFTPRSLKDGTSRQALFDITSPASNDSVIQSSPLRPNSDLPALESSPDLFPRELKRRKVSQLTETSGETSKDGNEASTGGSITISEDKIESGNHAETIRMSPFRRASLRNVSKEIIVESAAIPKRTTMEERGLNRRLLQLSLGDTSTSRRKSSIYPVDDWQNETANFYSGPAETHLCNTHHSGEIALPFCTATCNKNTLIALGDELGQVKILESEAGGKPPFHQTYVAFKPHTNAIFDMSFSQDDTLLGTASADQTAQVIDMETQQTISTLAQHTASIKQVRFQPGSSNNSVLATSSRDGSIEIWDLRCSGGGGPIKEIFRANDPILARVGQPGYGYAINSIYEAHKPYIPPTAIGKPRLSERAGIPSVTSLAFMPEGQEHILLSASEDNASVRVWDIRALYQTHKEWAIPLSATQQPKSHDGWRHFGIISMNLSGNGSRLYTLCKDNTVYAYSTAHLILGHAPELSASSSRWRRPAETQRTGLGALYGFRHPNLLTSSFYVKSDLRPEKDGKCEMLAVGSSKDGCAILFPTDERYLSFPTDDEDQRLGPIQRKRPLQNLRRSSSGISARVPNDNIPICQNGTALIRGHDKEVSSLAWTAEGELITLSDDFLVRCWREGPKAKEVRVEGEAGGLRWATGWADVSKEFDDDDQ